MNSLRQWELLTRSFGKTSGQERMLPRGAVLWFCIGVLICCAIGNVIWLDRHWLTLPPPWDQAFYLYMGLRYLHALVDYGPMAALREFIHLSTEVAPLYPLTTVPLYLLLGPSRLVAYLTNIFYLGLLLGGVYLLGAHLYGYGRRAGLLAAFIAATFTATVNYSRDYLLEFPATAFVTLGIYALWRSEAFHHRAWCLAFGVLAGLSVLTKTMAGVFFIGPVLFALVPLIWRQQLNGAVLRNFLRAVGVGILVAAIWWGPNYRTAFGYLIYYGFQAGSVPYSKGVAGILSPENLSYYALYLMNHGTSFFYALLFVGLMIFAGIKAFLGADHRNIDHDNPLDDATAVPQPGYLWVWLIAGYLILTFVPNKGEERYAQPLLPPIALLVSGATMAIGNSWVRRTVIGLTVVIGGVNYLGLTYGLPGLPPRLSCNAVAIISHEYPHYSWVRDKFPRSSGGQWPISAMLAALAELTERHRAREIAALRSRFLETARERSVAEDVQQIYRVILRREPDKRGFQKYATAVSAGQLSREGLIDLLRATAEFKHQRAPVLVVPDHPSFNASTLRYYAEAEDRTLSFFHILDGPIDAERLQTYDFVLVKSGGYQGPEFSTQYNAQIQAHIERGDSGFVLLPQRFSFPDDSDIVIFAAESVLS